MNQEQPSNALEIDPALRIRGCNTLDELYYVLRDIKQIHGSKRDYPAEELISHIGEAAALHEHGLLDAMQMQLRYVTNALSIRDTAKKLISKIPQRE